MMARWEDFKPYALYEWFAWYPVKTRPLYSVSSGHTSGGWVWLKKVRREHYREFKFERFTGRTHEESRWIYYKSR